MFDVGIAELSLLAVLGLLILGPERLPGVARTIGGYVRKARQAWNSVRTEIEAELAAEDVRKTIAEPLDELDELRRATESVSSEVEDAAANATATANDAARDAAASSSDSESPRATGAAATEPDSEADPAVDPDEVETDGEQIAATDGTRRSSSNGSS